MTLQSRYQDQARGTCTWIEKDYGDYWESNCGESFCFTTEGGPAAHRMKFCFGCGKPMAQLPLSSQTPDQE